MMQRIDLAPMLRETLTTPYSDMVTRSTGVALRDRIEQAITGASHRTTQLDFTAVGLLDFSCADEVVAKLLLRVAEEEGYLASEGSVEPVPGRTYVELLPPDEGFAPPPHRAMRFPFGSKTLTRPR